MARTPQKTRVQDFIVRSGDEIHGEDGSAPVGILARGGEDSGAVTNGASGEFRGGDGIVGSADGGPTEFRSGDGGPTGDGGSGSFRGGDAVGGSGGPVQFRGGDGLIGGSGEFRAGNGTTGAGGPAVFLAGNGTSGGSLALGSGIGSSGVGGPLAISSGDGPAGGGALSIIAGDGSGGGPITVAAGTGISAGGTISVTGGDDTGTTGDGGTVTVGGGNVTSPSGLGDGGSVLLVKGTAAGSGSDGSIVIDYATWPAADGTPGQFLSTNGVGVLSWTAGGGGSGDVVGPSSSIDDRMVAFDGVTGKLIKQGTVTATAVASHLTDTANPHSTSIANVGSGTLAQLNTAVTDATLDDSSASRPPSGAASGDLGGTYPGPTVNDGADGSAIHDNVASEISAIPVKAVPISGDFLLIEDSAVGNIKKHITIGTLPSAGASTLAATLTAGDTTGANNIEVSSTAPVGIQGTDSPTVAGVGFTVRGGIHSGATALAGGTLTLAGGNVTAGGGTGDAGDVEVQGGSVSGTGTPGAITMTTDATTAPLGIRTTAGFTGTTRETLTYGAQITAASGGGFTAILTLGTVSASGRNMKFDVWVTAQENGAATNFVSTKIAQAAWRSATGTTLATAHQSDEQGNGATFLTDITFSLVVSGNDVNLQVQNTSSGTTYVIDVAVECNRQEGGFSS